MKETPKVIVYGASGYTGKLVSESLAKRGIPFIAAGRNAERLADEMQLVKERLGADFVVECVAVNNTVEDLTPLFAKADVVINVVGPFMQLGWPVVEAALEANCHYLDTTGEQDWTIAIKEKFGQAFADKGLLMAPATSWMCSAGALAAEVCLETEGVDSLELVYQGDNGRPSQASVKSFLRMACNDGAQYYLDQNELKSWPNDKAYPVVLPVSSRVYQAHPWGGFIEPIWFQDDERVRSCSALMAIGDEIIAGVLQAVNKFNEVGKDMTADEREAFTNAMGEQLDSGEPDKEDLDANKSVVVCHARGRQSASTFVLHIAGPYAWSGEICAESAQRLLEGKLKKSGFQNVARAFGHRELLKVWHDAGICSMPE